MNPMQRSIIAILLSAIVAGCGSENGKPPAGATMPPAEVEVATVSPGTVTLTQDLPGRLEAWRTAEVRARVEGIVEKRLFTEGSDVKEGATLFQIDPRTYATARDAAKANVDAARLIVERYKPLLEIKAVSQQEFDAAQTSYKQAQATLAKADLDMENTRVPAPISGRIGRSLITEGALVGHGDATHLATIEQVDPIYVNFSQPGNEFLRLQAAVKAGRMKRSASTQVELLLEDGSVYPSSGTLLFSALAVDQTTGAVSVRARFPNPKHELLPGMFVRVRFPSAVADNAIRVPQRAVHSSPQGQFVMLVTPDGKAAPLPVKTGSMVGGDFIVTDGLKGGEQIIINGMARPGMPVKAMPWKPKDNPATPAAPAASPKKEG